MVVTKKAGSCSTTSFVQNGAKIYDITGGQSSVSSSAPLPNGVIEDATEVDVTELTNQYIAQYQAGVIKKNKLYEFLRNLWGAEVFEGSRHCWENMKNRTAGDYADLDSRFEEFPDFISHMGPRPSKQHSIHRKDNDQGYSPENCEWADKKTQSRVRSNTIYLTDNGEKLPLTEWAERVGIPASTLRRRMDWGWSDHDVIHDKTCPQNKNVPANAPWPFRFRHEWEAKFQREVGRYGSRLQFLAKAAEKKMARLSESFEYIFVPDDEFHTPTPDEAEAMKRWGDEYKAAKDYFDMANLRLSNGQR